jgi:hypothetical protein
MNFSGGCLCADLRYESALGPEESGYCHCTICRKSTGAPALAFASFPAHSFIYVKGEPSLFQSSLNGQREFCRKCGTQICFRESGEAKTVDVNSGTLDNPENAAPQFHIYTGNRISWFDIADQLPRHTHGPET